MPQAVMNAAPYSNPPQQDASVSPTYTTPTDDEKNDIALVSKCYEEGKKAREKYDKNWDKWEKFYDGDQWEQKRSAGKSMPVINIIKPVIQTILPIMTDDEPAFEVGPREPSDFDFADMNSKLVAAWWERTNMGVTLLQSIMASCFYHIGVQKVVWDEEAENGAGDVRVDDIDPRDIFIPKGSIDFNKNCPWVIHRMFKPLGEVRRKFPDKAEQIFASGSSKDLETSRISSLQGDINLVSPIDKKAKDIPTANVSGVQDDNTDVELYELWIDDMGLEEKELTDDKTGETKKVMKKKWPRGKVVVVAAQNRVHLATIENPRADGKMPFVRYINMVRPKRFYGDGEIEQLYELQRMVNKTAAVIYDCLNLMSNPVWICDTNSGVNPDMITNAVGQVIMKNPGTEVRREPAPPIQESLFQFYNELMKFVDQTSGIHDITQGRKPVGVTAGYAIETLQEAGQTRIRLKERNLNASLVQLGYLVVSTMMQYYREPRVTKITGTPGWPDYFEFYIKDLVGKSGQPNGQIQYVKKEHKYDQTAQKYVSGQWQNGEPSKGIFDIKVNSGTSLPYAKSQRSNLAMALFDKKAIDQKALLEAVDWPKYEELMKRMQEDAQQAAQAQQAQQSQNPQGGK